MLSDYQPYFSNYAINISKCILESIGLFDMKSSCLHFNLFLIGMACGS